MKLLTLLFAGLLSASSMQAAYYGNGNYYQPMIQDQLNDTGATSVDYRQHSPIVFQQIKAFAPFLTARDCGGGEAFKMINNVSFVNDVLDLTQDFSVTPQYLYFDTIGHGKVNPTDEDSKKQVYNFANFLQKAAPYLTALEKGDNSGLIATGSASSNVLASELARVGGEKSFSYLNPILFDQDWSKMEYLDSIKLGDGRTINLRSDFSTTGLALFWNTKAWINPTTVANPTVQDLNFARFIEQISCLLLVSKTDAASLNGNENPVTAALVALELGDLGMEAYDALRSEHPEATARAEAITYKPDVLENASSVGDISTYLDEVDVIDQCSAILGGDERMMIVMNAMEVIKANREILKLREKLNERSRRA